MKTAYTHTRESREGRKIHVEDGKKEDEENTQETLMANKYMWMIAFESIMEKIQFFLVLSNTILYIL